MNRNATRYFAIATFLCSAVCGWAQEPVRLTLSDAIEKGLQSNLSVLVADTRVYSPISEISPALTSDSAATNMQHMAVVRDYLVQP